MICFGYLEIKIKNKIKIKSIAIKAMVRLLYLIFKVAVQINLNRNTNCTKRLITGPLSVSLVGIAPETRVDGKKKLINTLGVF